MKETTRSISARLAISFCIASALPAAHASTDAYGQVLTLTPNAAETQMDVYWLPNQDSFSPRAPCNLWTYALYLYNDSTLAESFNQNNSPLLEDANGSCYLRKTITSGAVYTNKISPGTWSASANRASYPQIYETRTIQACTATQGKLPMYWARYNALTDNLYSLSWNQINTALGIGYQYRGAPFSMPSRARYGSAAFYRYFKGAPQFEHFYTYSTPEWQHVEQNGYTYEAVEGYVFTSPKPGTVALRRYALFNGANGDLQHYYTITPNDPAAAGWGSDGIVGYVCSP